METQAVPTEEPTEGLGPAEILTEEAIPTKEPTEEMTPAVALTEEEAPMVEPDEEPATPVAMVSGPTEKPDVPPVQYEEKEKGEVPHSSFPGWMEVLHPSWTVTPTGQAPLTLGELRWQHHSWSVGVRRTRCQRAKECRWAMQEEDDSSPSPESLEPIPKVALPLGLKGIAACLLRDSPFLGPTEASPEPRQPDAFMGPMVATVCTT